MSYQETLAHNYEQTRQRLRNGYGTDIEDTPISLKRTPKPDLITPLLKRIDALQLRIAEIERILEPRLLPMTPSEKILHAIVAHEKINKIALLSARRGRVVIAARHLGFYLCKKCTKQTLSQIGKVWGRDHTTILYGVEKVEKDRSIDNDLDEKIKWYEALFVKNGEMALEMRVGLVTSDR